MRLDAPFRLGPFIVDLHGRLRPVESDRFPSFRIAWRGCPVLARLDVGVDGTGQLALTAMVGRVPSSAGGQFERNQQRRSLAFGTLQRMMGDRSEAIQLRLLPDHRLTIEASRPIHLPVSAGDLLTQIACFLFDVGPYLDLLSEGEVPLEPVGAAPSRNGGMEKI